MIIVHRHPGKYHTRKGVVKKRPLHMIRKASFFAPDLVISGYDIIVNEAWGEKWVQGGWKNGRFYNKLPDRILDQVREYNPEIKTSYAKRRNND
jgi:hypothetical protein